MPLSCGLFSDFVRQLLVHSINPCSSRVHQVSVTVFIPHPLDSAPPSPPPHISRTYDLNSVPQRLFLTPPPGSKAVLVTLTSHSAAQDAVVMVRQCYFAHVPLRMLQHSSPGFIHTSIAPYMIVSPGCFATGTTKLAAASASNWHFATLRPSLTPSNCRACLAPLKLDACVCGHRQHRAQCHWHSLSLGPLSAPAFLNMLLPRLEECCLTG
jgi:hypothetical protein